MASKVLRRIMLFGFTQLFSVPEVTRHTVHPGHSHQTLLCAQALAIIPTTFQALQKVAQVRK